MHVIMEDLHWVDASTLALLGHLIDQVAAVPYSGAVHVSARFPAALGHPLSLYLPYAWPSLPYADGRNDPGCHRRQAPAGGNDTADYRQDRRRAPVYRRTHQDGHRVGPGQGARWALRVGRATPCPWRFLPHSKTLSWHVSTAWGLPNTWPSSALLWDGSFLYLAAGGCPAGRHDVQRALAQLVDAEMLQRRGLPPQVRYSFKHALLQEAAYTSLLRSTRRQYHKQIAQVLETRFIDTPEACPELLAHHYTQAGLRRQAIVYWQQAGQRALGRSAHVEAIGHLTTGLECSRPYQRRLSACNKSCAYVWRWALP